MPTAPTGRVSRLAQQVWRQHMAAPVSVVFSKQSGKIVADVPRVVVDPGGQVIWTSAEPDLTISFGAGHPFVGSGVFHLGEVANVRSDAPRGKSFTCTVTMGGV